MAKPLKYPKKFRMKLDKIAGAREQPDPSPHEPHSYWGSFLEKNSVTLMNVHIDDVLKRIEIGHTLALGPAVDMCVAWAPWITVPVTPP